MSGLPYWIYVSRQSVRDARMVTGNSGPALGAELGALGLALARCSLAEGGIPTGPTVTVDIPNRSEVTW
jgi:hypothetical protein